MRRKSSTLDDLEDHYYPVRSAILATAGLLVFKVIRHEQIIIYTAKHVAGNLLFEQ